MGERSKIEWTHHTFNPWLGCTRLSPACDHCYAETWSRRTGNAHLWQGERRRTSATLWQGPLKWNARCAAEGIRERVFCASLADAFDNQVPTCWRDDLWHRIDQCRSLDWMLLTKRPQNIAKMLPTPAIGAPAWGEGWPNVWLGTTIEDRARLRNLDHLRAVPAAVRFLSCEPLLEDLGPVDLTGIHLVIVGGESGGKARAMHPAWVRSLRDQCAAQGVAFFFKQWGEHADTHPDWPRARGFAMADDGTLYRPEDLAYPDGARYGEAIRAGHDRARLTMVYRVGKKAAGRLLDGQLHDALPNPKPFHQDASQVRGTRGEVGR